MLNLQLPASACHFAELRKGNPDTLQYYFLRYDKALKRYASFFNIDQWDANDLIYQSMMALWKHQTSIHSERDVHVFLRNKMFQLCKAYRKEND